VSSRDRAKPGYFLSKGKGRVALLRGGKRGGGGGDGSSPLQSKADYLEKEGEGAFLGGGRRGLRGEGMTVFARGMALGGERTKRGGNGRGRGGGFVFKGGF